MSKKVKTSILDDVQTKVVAEAIVDSMTSAFKANGVSVNDQMLSSANSIAQGIIDSIQKTLKKIK